MTQDKAPEWALKMAEGLPIQGDGFCDDGDIQTIALALSQAYERGQESMRERAATLVASGYGRVPGEAWGGGDGPPSKLDKCAHELYGYESCEDCAIAAIRSLPIKQEGGE